MWSKVTRTSKNIKTVYRIQNYLDITSEINHMKSDGDKWRLPSDKGSLCGSAAELQQKLRDRKTSDYKNISGMLLP